MTASKISRPKASKSLEPTPERLEWLEGRRSAVGASEVAAVLGLGAYGSPLSVWASKVGDIDASPTPALAALGNALEPYILAEAARLLEVAVEPPPDPFNCPDVPHLRATLDGAIVVDGEPPIPVEAKFITSDFLTFGDDPTLDWDALDRWSRAPDDHPFPALTRVEAAYVQVQTQMLCTGAKVGYLAALLGSRAGLLAVHGLAIPSQAFRLIRLERDEELHETISKAIPAFWKRHVEAGDPPPASKPSDLDAVKRHLRQARMGSEDERPQLASKVRQLNDLRTMIKATTTAAKTLEADLRAALGDSERALCGDWAVTLKPTKTGSRPLRIRELKG